MAARGRAWLAALLSLTSWRELGVLAIAIASRALPAKQVLVRLTARQTGLETPLSWHGTCVMSQRGGRLP